MFGTVSGLEAFVALTIILTLYALLVIVVVRWIVKRLASARARCPDPSARAPRIDRGFRVLEWTCEGKPPPPSELAPIMGVTIEEAAHLVGTLYFQDKASGRAFWRFRRYDRPPLVPQTHDNGGSPQ